MPVTGGDGSTVTFAESAEHARHCYVIGNVCRLMTQEKKRLPIENALGCDCTDWTDACAHECLRSPEYAELQEIGSLRIKHGPHRAAHMRR